MDARAWDERYAAGDLVWSAEPNLFVARECADLTPGRAVDVACGEGRNAVWLAGRGWRVTALDFSPVAVGKAARAAAAHDVADRVTTRVDDATTWEPDGPADLVLLSYLQLPADQRAEAVRRAFGALRTGGTLLVVAHDRSNLDEGTGGPQDPAVLFTAGDVLGDLAGAAYDVVVAGRVAREVAVGDPHGGAPAQARTAWDCLVRVRRTG